MFCHMSFLFSFLLFLLLGDTCFYGYGSFIRFSVPDETSTNVFDDSKKTEENSYVVVFPLAPINRFAYRTYFNM